MTRVCVMKSPPRFLQGAYRSAMRIALSEADRARDANHRPSLSLEAFLASATNPVLSSTPGRVRAEVPVVRTVPVIFCWMGELSSVRHVLEGDPIAPGSDATLNALGWKGDQGSPGNHLQTTSSNNEGPHFLSTPTSRMCVVHVAQQVDRRG